MEFPPIMGRSNLKKSKQSLIARLTVHSSVHPVHTVLLISESQYVGVEAHRESMGERAQLHSSLHVAGFVFGCIRGSESLGSVDKRC